MRYILLIIIYLLNRHNKHDSILDICKYFDVTPAEFFDAEIGKPILAKNLYYEAERLFKENLSKFVELLKSLYKSDIEAIINIFEKIKIQI